MKRLLFLDYLRGMLIFMMITYHAVVYCVFEGIQNAIDIIPENVMPFLLPLLLLLTWAALFAMLSGIAKSFNIYRQITSGSETIQSMLKQSLWRGIFIIFLHYFYLGLIGHFQRNFAGESVRSLLIGSLEVGAWRMLDLDILFFVDALFMTSTSGILASLLLWLLWRKDGLNKSRRNYIILIGLGCVWLFLSPWAHDLLGPIFYQWIAEGKYGIGILLSIFVGPRHSLFPYFSFALFGTVFGILLGEGASQRKIRTFGYGFGVFFIALDGILIGMQGMPQLTTAILPFTMYTLNIGLMLCLVTFLIDRIEFSRPNMRSRVLKRTLFFRRFGFITLSMYLLESTVSLFLAKVFRLIFPLTFGANALIILSYLFVNGILWVFIARLWAKVNFKLSFEWLTDKFLLVTCAHSSLRLDLNQTLYQLEWVDKSNLSA
ncbi:MAG: hypothetical protein ACTSWW_07855 [Promethearchaeota archaeon]